MILKNFFILFLFSCVGLFAQPYAPPVGQAGTTALYEDSSAFVSWATGCKVTRGYQDISNPSLGFASVGDSSMATGKAQSNGVVSLGDGGSAICTFAKPIMNGPGFDFAVFENSFDDVFLELGFVEVSSDGVHFVRFASHSLTDTASQTASFGSTDATRINNLAGKYRGGYGTPFDLQELAGQPNLDISAIKYVRIIDVVGSMNPLYATRDSYGNKVNDPWPTAYPSGGFDLDAVGVIYENTSTGLAKNLPEQALRIYPNPVQRNGLLKIDTDLPVSSVRVLDLSGKSLIDSEQKELDVSLLGEGIYLVSVSTERGPVYVKMVVE